MATVIAAIGKPGDLVRFYMAALDESEINAQLHEGEVWIEVSESKPVPYVVSADGQSIIEQQLDPVLTNERV